MWKTKKQSKTAFRKCGSLCPTVKTGSMSAWKRKMSPRLSGHRKLARTQAKYLFTAKSGTGKSTHTRLWRRLLGDRAVMVNDDKPLLHIGADGVTGYGTPYNGKHRLGCNMSVPLKAICILTRAAENSIVRITKAEAYSMLLQQVYRPADPVQMKKTLVLIDRLAEQTALYRLGCNMDLEAAEVAYNGMKG